MQNGNGEQIPTAPSPEQVAAAAAKIQAIDKPMEHAIGTLLRGLLVSFPGIPPHVVLSGIAWRTGHFLGSSLQGDIATLGQLRKGFIDAFTDGVRKAPLVQAATNLNEAEIAELKKKLAG